ncbi:hypothetical protein [Dyella sp. ASV21]|uniref:hypothetical protein n=1 Tax=Dyella sp. ASV21 TaxID=2795114 RepID=UPI0018EDB97F|nr:hypothetical protein [Dyella sp. ASV21]
MNQFVNIKLPSKPIQANMDMLAERERVGVGKYGVTLGDAGLGHEALLQHGLEEALDLANYLQTALMTERENAKYKTEHGLLMETLRDFARRIRADLIPQDDVGEAFQDLLHNYVIQASRRGVWTRP